LTFADSQVAQQLKQDMKDNFNWASDTIHMVRIQMANAINLALSMDCNYLFSF
jgi:hypothetical protein